MCLHIELMLPSNHVWAKEGGLCIVRGCIRRGTVNQVLNYCQGSQALIMIRGPLQYIHVYNTTAATILTEVFPPGFRESGEEALTIT